MNRNNLIRLTNTIGIITVTALIYWIFIYAVVNIFQLQIFTHEIFKEIFQTVLISFASISFGMLAINLMLNITKISESLDRKTEISETGAAVEGHVPVAQTMWVFAAVFPLILFVLFALHLISGQIQKTETAEKIEFMIKEYPEELELIGNYSFDKKYIEDTRNSLSLLSATGGFTSMSVIIKDTVKQKPVYLMFSGGDDYYNGDDSYDEEDSEDSLPEKLKKNDYVFYSTAEEKKYIKEVFAEKNTEYRYTSENGAYKLFYPVKLKNNMIILYVYEYPSSGN